jgi:hypothetical protein
MVDSSMQNVTKSKEKISKSWIRSGARPDHVQECRFQCIQGLRNSIHLFCRICIRLAPQDLVLMPAIVWRYSKLFGLWWDTTNNIMLVCLNGKPRNSNVDIDEKEWDRIVFQVLRQPQILNEGL